MKLITVFRKNDGSALSGLVPKITINNVTDINVPFLEIDKDSMIDIKQQEFILIRDDLFRKNIHEFEKDFLGVE